MFALPSQRHVIHRFYGFAEPLSGSADGLEVDGGRGLATHFFFRLARIAIEKKNTEAKTSIQITGLSIIRALMRWESA